MRIGIDARMYGQYGGIGRYVRALIQYLQENDTTNEYIIFMRKQDRNLYQSQNENFKTVVADIPWYSIREQLFFPLLLYRFRLDLMHFTHFSAPVFYRKSYLLTLHDLIMLTLPRSSRLAATTHHTFFYTIKYIFYRMIITILIHGARKIICVSHTVKNEVVSKFHIRADKVCVVYNGISLQHESSKPRKISSPFFLSVGSSYPHKNLEFLIAVWAELRKRRFLTPLVLCGQNDYFTDDFRRKVKENNLEDLITHHGTVSDTDLAWLYKNAVALIIPSYAEGFGLPCVEAGAAGLPIFASNITIFHEILGQGILYFDPKNAKELAEMIVVFSRQIHQWRQTALQKKNDFLLKYQWKHTAEQTLSLYRAAIGIIL